MRKKYTDIEFESGMVSEPSAALKYNVEKPVMFVSTDDSEPEEEWDWQEQWTPEEFQARIDSYDDDDPDDPNQEWYTHEEMFAELEQLIHDYAVSVEKAF